MENSTDEQQSLDLKIDTPQEELAFLKGTVSIVTFKNEENGFGIFKIAPDYKISSKTNALTVAVVGTFPPNITKGSHIVARGKWMEHPKFGKQFKAYSVVEAEPVGEDAVEKYLASGAIKGFGPVLAKRVVEEFGADALKILEENPHRLLEVPGIGERKFKELLEAWDEKKNQREVILFFQQHQVALGLATRIFAHYGTRSIEIVKNNPYVLARDVWGIGFSTADEIAQKLGIEPKSLKRIAAGIGYALRRASEDGHCYLPKEILLAKTSSLLDLADTDLISEGLQIALEEGELYIENENVFSAILYKAEVELSKNISKLLLTSELKSQINPKIIEEYKNFGIKKDTSSVQHGLSAEQQKAIEYAANSPILVITGGPGCGKTTVVQTITKMFRHSGVDVCLAAPTGRAAQRLSEVCSHKASTIHRLLKYDPIKRKFFHDDENLLPYDVIIIDESSMIDLLLGNSLLKAIQQGARLIFVGDSDQLPSVGPGLFLSDLLNVQDIPRVRLTQLFRRLEESYITQLAYDINAGITPQIPEPDGQTKTDAYFISIKDQAHGAQLIEKLVIEQIPKKFGVKLTEITVLTPMNQGDLGAISLNKRLQEKILPLVTGQSFLKSGQLDFRLGDRVCQRVNNYQIDQTGVFNGDQGTIIAIDAENRNLVVKLWDGREVKYENSNLAQLDLAYAMTIHRSQGSEVPVVVLALHDSHYILLDRQLIYTAVTRAKKLLIIVGTKQALSVATRNSRSRQRFTTLAARIKSQIN